MTDWSADILVRIERTARTTVPTLTSADEEARIFVVRQKNRKHAMNTKIEAMKEAKDEFFLADLCELMDDFRDADIEPLAGECPSLSLGED